MAANSKRILAFLDRLDEWRIDLDTAEQLLEFYKTDFDEFFSQWAMSDEDLKAAKGVRQIFQRVLKTKQELARDLPAEAVRFAEEILGEGSLDEAITRLHLLRVTDVVRRWKKLRAFEFVAVPEDRVLGSLRQAVNCYVQGLPDATAVLCRMALELALEDAFAEPGGVSLREATLRIPAGALQARIAFAERAHILSEDL